MKPRRGQHAVAFVIALATMLFVPDGSGETRNQLAELRDGSENRVGAGRMTESERRIVAEIEAAKARQLRRPGQKIPKLRRSGIRKPAAAAAVAAETPAPAYVSPIGEYHSTAPAASPGGLWQLLQTVHPVRHAPAQITNVKPTWETRPMCIQGFPAPRGQIVDRNGEPLAQTRLCVNLGINFPTPLDMIPSAAVAFARTQIGKAQRLTRRRIVLDDEAISSHYANRGSLPLDIVRDLTVAEQKTFARVGGAGLIQHPIYVRSYPNGSLAAHTLGYVGRTGPTLDGPSQITDLLWPEVEGREGLELSFNEQLTGKPGQVTYNFDAQGKKVSEKITVAPEPGCNVVTTLDVKLQRLCEKALATGCKRGAMIFIDPKNGDILAMASHPTFDPNVFVPAISEKQFKALNDNPNLPMLPRTFRSAYPPGSTFKMFVGLAALESKKITLDQQFPGPGALQVGNFVMHNWKKGDAGMLNFEEALVESCDTWFYQVGLKTGAKPIVDWALKFGFAAKTGIPLKYEAEGTIPTDDYLVKRNLPSLAPVGIANISIGQGDVLVTPLQMAQAMATIANGGAFRQTRLVQHVQDAKGKIVAGYDPQLRDQIEMRPRNLTALKEAMLAIVKSKRGTAPQAAVQGVEVAGKTGTAQWGPKAIERYAAWFAGYAPADKPKYAFAALYESDPGQRNAHGGTVAAPMIGKVLRETFKQGLQNEMIANGD